MTKRTKHIRKPTQHDIDSENLPSASAFDACFRCLGRWMLAKNMPRTETSDAARGVRIHKALETTDLEGLSKSDATTASRIMYAEAELVHTYNFEGAEVEWERRFWDVDDSMQHLWSAQLDTLHWQPQEKRLLITDNKTGWALTTPIEQNWQLKAQAALVGVEYYDAQEVVAALIHPHHPDSLHESVVYSRAELEANLATVRYNVELIQRKDQPRTVGGIQCHFCPAKRVCPEYIAHSKALEQAIADEIEDRGFTAINRRSPKQRGEHVRALKEQQSNIEALLDQYTELARRDGSAVDGYTLARRTIREITNDVEAMSLVKGEYGADVLYDCTVFSVAALEDRLAKNMKRREAKAAVERLLSPVLKFKTTKSYLKESRSL